MKGIVDIKEISKDDKTYESGADDDAGYCLSPGFVVVGKHLESPFILQTTVYPDNECRWLF